MSAALAVLGAILLQGGAGEPPSFFATPMFPMLIILFIFWYFLLIRPQRQRQKQRDEMLKAIVRGDTVATTGGLHGKVSGLTDDVLTLEIASVKGDRVRVKVDRPQVDRVVEKAKRVES